MRHDVGRARDESATAATTDTALIGLLIIGGVLLALATASKIVVAILMAILLVTGLVGLRALTARRSNGAGSDPVSEASGPPSA